MPNLAQTTDPAAAEQDQTISRYAGLLVDIITAQGPMPGMALRNLFDAHLEQAGEKTDGTAYYQALAHAVREQSLRMRQGPEYATEATGQISAAPATTDDSHPKYVDAVVLAAVRAAADNYSGGLPLAKLARLTEDAMRATTDTAWRWTRFGQVLADLEARDLITRHLNATELGDDLIVPAEQADHG